MVADAYLAGVSTRRMDKLIGTLGINSLSKSQVSRMAAELDEHVASFRNRPLGDAGPFIFVAADALTMKVREGGRVVSAVVLTATGVNADGHREVLGLRVATPARAEQRGTSSSPTWSPEAWEGYDLSPLTPTRVWSRPSPRTCPERPGSAAASTTPPT